jgi:hypothetical protein
LQLRAFSSLYSLTSVSDVKIRDDMSVNCDKEPRSKSLICCTSAN